MVIDGASNHNMDYVVQVWYILNLKQQHNPSIFWNIWELCWMDLAYWLSCNRKDLRHQPEQHFLNFFIGHFLFLWTMIYTLENIIKLAKCVCLRTKSYIYSLFYIYIYIYIFKYISDVLFVPYSKLDGEAPLISDPPPTSSTTLYKIK